MSIDSSDEFSLSDPWGIEFWQDDNQVPNDPMNNMTAQAESLSINEQNVAAQAKSPVSWVKHERLTGDILNEAAQRVAAETFKNICVYHPTQNHRPSKDTPGKGIRPDYIIAWSYNGVRKNTLVVDPKDYHGEVPREEYRKICRDMRETKATRGILVLSKDSTINDTLLADIKKDNKVDIVQIKGDRADVVRDVTQHIGKIIDKDFVPDDKHYETYKPFVNSTEKEQERRPNRYGENPTYTCDATYHRFNHPRKQDDTIDERYKANQDRNKDGGPDKRMVQNKSEQAQEQHLNDDGSDDMRSKEHREDMIDNEGHRLNADQTPDMRCQENKTNTPTNTSSDGNNDQTTENIDMRQKENREKLVDNEGHRLNADQTPDMRCQENKTDTPTNTSSDGNNDQTTDNADMRQKENREDMVDNQGHRLNVDQTPDMRCQENIIDTPTNTSSSGNNDQANENVDMRQKENREELVDNEGHHLNVDQTPDMRCKENQEEIDVSSSNEPQLDTNQTAQEETNEVDTAIPTKTDGTADMRYTESKEAVASGAIEPDEQLTEGNDTIPTGGNEGFAEGSTSNDITTKSDGTADMRYSASQDAVASGEISRDEVLSGGNESSVGGTIESSSGMMDNIESGGGGGGDGPAKADGTPDMRFSENQ